MRDPTRVRVTGPLARYAEGFRGELTQLGYGRDGKQPGQRVPPPASLPRVR
ncbi:hypothetical protein [Pseudofrankia sp. BMG5.37]|uniref:hypothetical protein n=1 Tax=Pseudofrankia sp. BMG5.37 TaxID=3050035 RepID=UPI0028953F4E|nr:hypothetical protein [Pseudofrankia sp. BMG5.37]MDT3446027.1 hypothetical protein [Pseudofrankia sp. BMG5.37]